MNRLTVRSAAFSLSRADVEARRSLTFALSSGAVIALAGLAPREARALTVVGKLYLTHKDVGSHLKVQFDAEMSWGTINANKRIFVASFGVPKSGKAVSLNAPVPGGQFKILAYIKNDDLTVQVTAQSITGATLSKTVTYPAHKHWGTDVTWAI